MSNNLKIMSSIAESVKAEILYDLSFNISPTAFFRAKFDIARYNEKKLSSVLYKKIK